MHGGHNTWQGQQQQVCNLHSLLTMYSWLRFAMCPGNSTNKILQGIKHDSMAWQCGWHQIWNIPEHESRLLLQLCLVNLVVQHNRA